MKAILVDKLKVMVSSYEGVKPDSGEGNKWSTNDTPTNREVLERAYEVVDRQKITDGSGYAIEAFHRHLDKLRATNCSGQGVH